MTTPRDLLIITMDVASSRPVEQGDLSLALAGAELVDLLGAQALTLDDDRIVPGPQGTVGDRLLDEAASSLVRKPPYESVEDWLWRRGRDLSSAYLTDWERGPAHPRRHRWIPGRTDRTELTDSPARRRATDRWTSGEPVLAALAAAVGVQDEQPEEATEHHRRRGRDRTGRRQRRHHGTGSRTATATGRGRGLRQHLARHVTDRSAVRGAWADPTVGSGRRFGRGTRRRCASCWKRARIRTRWMRTDCRCCAWLWRRTTDRSPTRWWRAARTPTGCCRTGPRRCRGPSTAAPPRSSRRCWATSPDCGSRKPPVNGSSRWLGAGTRRARPRSCGAGPAHRVPPRRSGSRTTSTTGSIRCRSAVSSYEPGTAPS